MSPTDLAREFLDGFSTGDLDRIRRVLHDDFAFTGPLFSCSSAAEYVAALQSAPHEANTITIEKLFEAGDEVCVLFQFTKTDIATDMAQWFRCHDSKIVATKLIFDGRVFSAGEGERA